MKYKLGFVQQFKRHPNYYFRKEDVLKLMDKYDMSVEEKQRIHDVNLYRWYAFEVFHALEGNTEYFKDMGA